MPVVVVGVTGCIAAYKACEVVRELQRRDVDVHVVMTSAATKFVGPMTFEALSQHPVFHDQWALGANSDIPHISIADQADLLLVAPATANIIGKFAQGIADDALSTLYTATVAPTLLAPAMNVNMYDHPAVRKNLEILKSRGVGVVEPGSGYLACGWLGRGRLAEVDDIVDAAMAALARRKDLEGETVLVTAGPTVEDIDPVRFLSNRSTGTMGYRLAEAARDRGAKVVLVSGPTHLPAPRDVELVAVRSAAQMAEAVDRHFEQATVVVGAAAVADYRPEQAATSKLKKGDGSLELELVRTTDILGSLGKRKGDRLLVGFAAETEDLVPRAQAKLLKKNLDLVVANDVAAGFGGETNQAVLVRPEGDPIELPKSSKRELAERICDEIAGLRSRRPAGEPVGAGAGRS